MLSIKPYSNYVLVAIDNIKKHINNDPFRYKTAAELLDHLITPHRNLVEKAFKEVYGSRIKEYQVKQRLQMAKQYLNEGLPKKLVATKCLYGSSSAFSTAFKKEFGLSPSKWERTYEEDITATSTAKR